MPQQRPRPPISPLAFLPIAILMILIAVLLYVYKRRQDERLGTLRRGLLEQQDVLTDDDQTQGSATARQSNLRHRGMENEDTQIGADEEEDDEGDSASEGPIRVRKVGKKKAEKLRKKEERRQYNEWLDAQREQRRLQDELQEDEFRRRKIEEEEIRVRERLQQEKRQAKIAAEQEAERMRRMQAAENEQRRKDELIRKIGPKMVEFIKANKVASVNTLSSTFNISREDAMLLLSHHTRTAVDLTGIFDEPRDRYVYINRDEYDKLAGFVRSRGRIGLTELAQWVGELASNREIK